MAPSQIPLPSRDRPCDDAGELALGLAEAGGFGGVRPLHSAALAGQAKVVTILLKSGAQVDSPDNTGRTPLLAFMSGNVLDVSTLIALLDGGADPNLLDGPLPTTHWTMLQCMLVQMRPIF